MATVQQIKVPEALLQLLINKARPRELYGLQYLSSVRPDPRDLDKIIIVVVDVYHMARDVEDMIRLVHENIPTVMIGRTEHELPVLSIVTCSASGGISEEAMLVVKGEDEEVGAGIGSPKFKLVDDDDQSN